MKRITTIVLVIVLIMNVFCIGASAAEPEKEPKLEMEDTGRYLE